MPYPYGVHNYVSNLMFHDASSAQFPWKMHRLLVQRHQNRDMALRSQKHSLLSDQTSLPSLCSSPPQVRHQNHAQKQNQYMP